MRLVAAPNRVLCLSTDPYRASPIAKNKGPAIVTDIKIESVRNIALVGPAGAGKTTLAERLLAKAGAIKAPGSVDRGTTVCDFDAQERELKHSLETTLCHFQHEGTRINLIDTPGYPDFIGRSISVLPAVETAALVLSAQAGIE